MNSHRVHLFPLLSHRCHRRASPASRRRTAPVANDNGPCPAALRAHADKARGCPGQPSRIYLQMCYADVPDSKYPSPRKASCWSNLDASLQSVPQRAAGRPSEVTDEWGGLHSPPQEKTDIYL